MLLSHSYRKVEKKKKKREKFCCFIWHLCDEKTATKEFILVFLQTFCKRHGLNKKKFPYFGAVCLEKKPDLIFDQWRSIAIEAFFGHPFIVI